MAALVENMFSVRQKPWHGVGTILDNPPSIEEGIVAAGLDWEVAARPIYINFGGSRQKVDNYVANTRMTDGKVLGVVSDKYKAVQNIEAFQFVNNLIDEGMQLETAGSLEGGKSIWVLGKLPSKYILGDEVENYICFNNRHDGLGSVRCLMTPTRVVCNNTLNLAISNAKRSWACRHLGDVNSKIQEARDILFMSENYMEKLSEEAEILAVSKISDEMVDSILSSVYGLTDTDSDIRRKRIDDKKELFFNLMNADDVKKFKGTKYAVIMAATDLIDHSESKRGSETFKDNRWRDIMNGHPFVDTVYKMVKAV